MCLSSYSPPPVAPLPPPPANPAQPQLAPVVANGGEDVSKKVQDLTSNLTSLVIPYTLGEVTPGNLPHTQGQVPNPLLTQPQRGPSTVGSTAARMHARPTILGTTTPSQGSLPSGNGSYQYNPGTNTVLTIQPAANRLSPTSTRTG